MHKCSGVEKKTKWKVILLDHFYHDASPLNHGGKYVLDLFHWSTVHHFSFSASEIEWATIILERYKGEFQEVWDLAIFAIYKPMDEFQQQQQQRQWPTINQRMGLEILLVEEILHQLIWQITHYLQGFIHLRWCRISSINSMVVFGKLEINHHLKKSIYIHQFTASS